MTEIQKTGFAASLTLAAWAFAGATALGQPAVQMAKDAKPSFEVATIKLTDPRDQTQGFHLRGHRISIENETVQSMMMFAYALHDKQIVDAPAWFATERYDVDGVPDAEGSPNLTQYQEMVRKLLEERFGLKAHRDKRELPVYAITVAKGGPKIAKTAQDDPARTDQTGGGDAGGQYMRFTNNSMDEFALGMQYYLSRPAVNQTGLDGRFDFTLRWARDELSAAEPNASPGMFTAMQEQLGLKLEATKGMVDVLVVDHVERPSSN